MLAVRGSVAFAPPSIRQTMTQIVKPRMAASTNATDNQHEPEEPADGHVDGIGDAARGLAAAKAKRLRNGHRRSVQRSAQRSCARRRLEGGRVGDLDGEGAEAQHGLKPQRHQQLPARHRREPGHRTLTARP